MTAQPFKVHVDDEVLADLRTRLSMTRFADPTSPVAWEAGTDPAYLRELVGYWREGFDWRARERALNAVPQFVAKVGDEVGGGEVHYAHVTGVAPPSGAAPMPLLMVHGWPSAFSEMLKIIPLLTDPGGHGADPEDAFDVVVPSLPGSLWSSLPSGGPLTRPRMADLFAGLMTGVLGHDRFGAYGGDIGADVSHWLATRHASHVAGVHLIHPRLPASLPDGLSERERSYLADRDTEDEDDGGYGHEQSTRPDTLAAALLDSPAGLASWIVEKLRAWSDCGDDVESRFSKDEILTLVTLYWATGTIGSSFRSYYDYEHNPPRTPCAVPAGFTVSAEDSGHPRELADRVYSDIRLWREPGAGGHFFPAEEPEILARDLRDFFRPLRSPA